MALLLSFAVRAQEPGPALDVRQGYLVTKDGRGLDVGAGCWLEERRCVDVGKRVARAEAESASLKKPPESASIAPLVLLLVVVAGVGGYVAGRVSR